MRRLTKTKAGRILLGLALGLGCFALIAWQLMRPKIGHASLAEIEAVLPPELRTETRIDEAAARRMDRVIEMSKLVNDSAFKELKATQSNANHHFEFAKVIWAEDDEMFAELKRLLDAGPLQFRPFKDPDASRASVGNEKDLVECLAEVGLSFVQAGDIKDGQFALDLSISLSKAIFDAGGDLLNYLIAIAIAAVSDARIQRTAVLPNCPPELCRHWLNQLPPTSGCDAALLAATKEEFRDMTLPLLLDPQKMASNVVAQYEFANEDTADFYSDRKPPKPDSNELFGTLDPLATARIMARLVPLELQNDKRPLSLYDETIDRLIADEDRSLPVPDEGSLSKLTWKNVVFRFVMNNSKNTLGKAMISFGMGVEGKSTVNSSCHWRVVRECTRVLLASVLYRKDHSGNLPTTLSDLVPKYLPAVPIDPFNGKPMLYNRSKQVVYSVGMNLIDDGGEITAKSFIPKDIGVSLAMIHD